MIDCLIVGDSIAVGVAHERPECVAYVKGGINTHQWNVKHRHDDLTANTVIISLGTNDYPQLRTKVELNFMRGKVKASKVYWILPPCNDKFCKPDVNEWVKEIAKEYNDVIISTKRLQKDAIHPSWAGYKELANQTK
jgi:lysophospholipase L1-like esterase